MNIPREKRHAIFHSPNSGKSFPICNLKLIFSRNLCKLSLGRDLMKHCKHIQNFPCGPRRVCLCLSTCVCVCVMLVLCLLCVCIDGHIQSGANMFEQLCAYYANGFLVDRVELGLDLTMSKRSTHTHRHTWNTQHTRTADDNGMCLNKHACQTAKTQLRFAPSHASHV